MLIYIGGIFNTVTEISPLVISSSFVNNPRLIVSETLVKKIVQTSETVVITVLKWDSINAVTYDAIIIEFVMFSKSHRQRLSEQL